MDDVWMKLMTSGVSVTLGSQVIAVRPTLMTVWGQSATTEHVWMKLMASGVSVTLGSLGVAVRWTLTSAKKQFATMACAWRKMPASDATAILASLEISVKVQFYILSCHPGPTRELIALTDWHSHFQRA